MNQNRASNNPDSADGGERTRSRVPPVLLPPPCTASAKALDLLVVDDDFLVHELITRNLRGSGCALCALTCNDEAESLLREQTPANLLVDYRMPGRDGLDFINDCHRCNLLQGARVYVMSSETLPGDVEFRFLELGVRSIVKDRLIEPGFLPRLLAA